jgi:integrase
MYPQQKLSLYRRSNGFYYIGFEVDGNRHWKSTGKRKKSDALRAMSDYRESIAVVNDHIKLGVLKKKVLSHVKDHYRPKTHEIYKLALDKFYSYIGDIKVSKISQYHIDKFKLFLLKNVSANTVNIYLRMLKASFNHAIRWNDIEKNPFKGVEMVKVPERAPIHFKKEEFSKVLGAIQEDWLRDAVLFTLLTGVRRGEMINLRWEEVDMESKLVHIQSSATFRTKAGKRRAIPLNDTALEILRKRITMQDCEYVFSNKGKQLYAHWVTKKFRQYVRGQGLNRLLHFHSLRHTFATWLVKAGVSIYEVQKLLGHSNVTVTQVYSHLASEELHSAVARLQL